MILEEGDDRVPARPLDLVSACKTVAEATWVEFVEPRALEVPVDSGQGEHRPLAVRFDQTYAPAAVEHGAIAARGYAQGFKACLLYTSRCV